MSSTKLFSRTAANTIPYPAPQVHKFPRPSSERGVFL